MTSKITLDEEVVLYFPFTCYSNSELCGLGIPILPTAEQGIRCVILCQSLTNTFTPIFIVRLDEQTGNVSILLG